ncbi:hypothetical protein ABS754_001920 [Listeria monocytogenes]|nr:hypothetical protein [Listeria monocytogenes]EEO6477010.1 hypothetical protein [Listeria monocytogenes]EGB2304056.1 hypothetical protein [Listeria monocytogenes]EGK2610683.1 hypothetical protein [Listeria monocytogenes]EHX2086331.1 hypothetical protein [Listeria monocytogenes]
MKEVICIDTKEKYKLNKLYANITGLTGVFACIEIERRLTDYKVTFEVVWRPTK